MQLYMLYISDFLKSTDDLSNAEANQFILFLSKNFDKLFNPIPRCMTFFKKVYKDFYVFSNFYF